MFLRLPSDTTTTTTTTIGDDGSSLCSPREEILGTAYQRTLQRLSTRASLFPTSILPSCLDHGDGRGHEQRGALTSLELVGSTAQLREDNRICIWLEDVWSER